MWLEPVLVVLAAVAAAIGGMLLVRRSVDVALLESHNDVAGFIYGVLGVVYAVLVGFAVVSVWERHTEIRWTVEREANELADLYRSAEAFPVAVWDTIQTRIRRYAEIVIADEWPALAAGRTSDRAWQAYDGIWQAFLDYSPATDRERSWYDASLDRLNDLGDHRRLRLLPARTAIPQLLWVTLVVLGCVTVAYTYFFGARNTWAQALMTATITAAVAGVLYLILALESPFSGPARIEPIAFEEFLRIVERWGAP